MGFIYYIVFKLLEYFTPLMFPFSLLDVFILLIISSAFSFEIQIFQIRYVNLIDFKMQTFSFLFSIVINFLSIIIVFDFKLIIVLLCTSTLYLNFSLQANFFDHKKQCLILQEIFSQIPILLYKYQDIIKLPCRCIYPL